jgi:hypothetical protein
MKLKLQFYTPIARDPNIEMVTEIAPAVCEPGERDLIDWAFKVWDYRRFEYPLQITLRVDDEYKEVPLWLMKYTYEWAADPFKDDNDGIGFGGSTFYVLKPFRQFTPYDHALVEEDWRDAKGDHSIRTDYDMDNAGVLYTPQYEQRHHITLIHRAIKGTLFRK